MESTYTKSSANYILLPSTDRVDVLNEAISTYGHRAQVDMIIEEMAELTQALLKERRYLSSGKIQMCAHEKKVSNISEEMADVIIMLMQLLIIFDNSESVQSYINSKINRLAERIDLVHNV